MNSKQLIIGKIQSYRRKKLTYIVWAGLINLIVYFSIIWMGTFIADTAFYFSTPTRIVLLVIVSCLSLYLLYQNILLPIILYFYSRYTHDFTLITREIGENVPQLADKLTNIYQLITGDIGKESIELRDYAVEKYAEKIKDIDFNKDIKLKRYLLPYSLIFFVIIAAIFLFINMYQLIGLSALRIFNPWGEYEPVPQFIFQVNPGTMDIISGNSLTVSVTYQGPRIQKCLFKYKFRNADGYQITEMMEEKGLYTALVENLKKPIEYYIQGVPEIYTEWYEKIMSEKYDINILYPPYIADLQVKIYPPAYTHLPVQYLERNTGDILAYKGSKIEIDAKANKELINAFLIFEENEILPIKVMNTKMNAYFIATKDVTYHFKILDHNSIINQNPIEYSITILEDLPPLVEIVEPGKDVELSPDAAINLLIEGNDDFGFGELYLNYQIIGSVTLEADSVWYKIPIPLIVSNIKYFQQYYPWDLATLPVSFDDAIKYYVTLSDNNAFERANLAKSFTYYIRFPSLNQIFEEFSSRQNNNIKELEEIVKESKEVEDNLQKLNRDLKKKSEINWEEKREINASLEQQKIIHERLEEIENELNESIQKLENDQLLSNEIFDKYQQLQELFMQVVTPEIIKAMEETKKLLDKISKGNIDNSLENFQISQKQLLEKLERTLELYKKVKIEQELDRIVQMAKKISEEQKKISKQLDTDEGLNSEDISRIEARETAQERIFENLVQSVDSLTELDVMQNISETDNLLQNARNYINQSNIKSKMKSILAVLAEKDQISALQQSDQLSENLESLYQQLKQAQQSLLSDQKEKIMSKMIKNTEDLISLSKEEESLIGNTKKLSNLSDQFRDMTIRQYNIKEDVDQVIRELIALSKETFSLPPELNISLSKVQNSIEESINALENRNQKKAEENQTNVMAALNQSVILMQNSMEMISESSSGLGFEQFLQQMQNITGEQCRLNQETLSLFQNMGNRGNLTLEEQSQLKRIAAEQAAIKQTMEQLHDAMGNRSDILGRIDRMAKEMDEIIKDMEEFKIDRKTIERQQQILSRMLDAQKSVRGKEYSRKRIAEIGKEYFRRPPSERLETIDKMREKLRKELLKALQEGYNPDYEMLIENYFKKLNKLYLEN
jgi:hypothetical protein